MVLAGRSCYTAVLSMVDTKQLQETLAQDLCAGDGAQGTWRRESVLPGCKALQGQYPAKFAWCYMSQAGTAPVPCRCKGGASPACDLVHKTPKHSL